MNKMTSKLINNIVNLEFIEFVFNNSNDIFWIIDQSFRLVFISPAIESITGYTKEEFILLSKEQKYTETTIDKLNRIYELVSTTKLQDGAFDNIQIEYISKSGEIVLVEVKGNIIYDEYGIFRGIYGISKKISEELKLQNELLIEKERNSIARQFTSNILGLVGHEFITPLNGILGFTKILSKNAHSDDESDMLNDIYHSAQRLNAALNSVVTLAAIESNQLQIENIDVDLYEILNNLKNTFQPIIEIKKIEFDINIDISVKGLVTDENCLYQILYQLIDNAIKFTDEGNICVNIIGTKINDKEFIEISVEDSGIGISDSKFDTIFEPFRQISEGHDRHYEGLGLGLSTAKRLVDKLNGFISVSSTKGSGSIFSVFFPKYADISFK
ncbi:MAG: PAS domain S-box protein [Candidatus Kapabacteria bacterium]|nr:PAS domain S-box protein [Ignavibacteriota bacterium]MCW5884754.1 PAS domain S-box protein [Candidatus Kapabacteria bacterium]